MTEVEIKTMLQRYRDLYHRWIFLGSQLEGVKSPMSSLNEKGGTPDPNRDRHMLALIEERARLESVMIGIENLICSLPPSPARFALYTHYIQGLSLKDTAKALGYSYSRACDYLREGLKALAEKK